MKVIFLDIDGVLNCQSSKSSCHGMVGIDNDKVKRLKEIVKATGAKMVLISTWKTDWQKEKETEHIPLSVLKTLYPSAADFPPSATRKKARRGRPPTNTIS